MVTIEGRVIMDLPLQEGVSSKTGNPWKKKEWVLETLGNYPRKIKVQMFNDRVDTVHFEIGKTYQVQADIESREFNGRWYTDVTAISAVEVNGAAPVAPAQPGGFTAAPAAPQPFGAAPVAPAAPFAPAPDAGDDLPF